MRVNEEIRAPRVRVIGASGEQIGIMPTREALHRAQDAGLDLVEVVADSNPPVCKIINFGKFRYDQTKREKESKKQRTQSKVKEIKLKPNIDIHDYETKLRHAKEFLEEGNKVKVTLTFRGREMAHKELGMKLLDRVIKDLEEVATCESPLSMLGRNAQIVMAPGAKKKKGQENTRA